MKTVHSKLARLRRQHRALASKLQQINGKIAKLSPVVRHKKLSPEALDRILDELANGPRPARSLAADFSRTDIYDDHD